MNFVSQKTPFWIKHFADSRRAVLRDSFFLLLICTALVTLMFSSPEVKKFKMLDPHKKVTHYQSTQFLKGFK